MVCLPVKVMPSLIEALSKLQPLHTPATATDSNLIKIGDSCKNSGCNEVFSGCEDEEGVWLNLRRKPSPMGNLKKMPRKTSPRKLTWWISATYNARTTRPGFYCQLLATGVDNHNSDYAICA